MYRRVVRTRYPPLRTTLVPRPYVVTNAPINNNGATQNSKTKKNKNTNGSDFVTKAFMSFASNLQKPEILILSVLLIGAVLMHKIKPEESIIKHVADKLNQSDSTKNISLWISNNGEKFFGIATFSVTYFALPKNVGPIVIVGSCLLVVLLPAADIMIYGVYSVLLILYLKMPAKTDKLIVLCLSVILSFYVWFF